MFGRLGKAQAAAANEGDHIRGLAGVPNRGAQERRRGCHADEAEAAPPSPSAHLTGGVRDGITTLPKLVIFRNTLLTWRTPKLSKRTGWVVDSRRLSHQAADERALCSAPMILARRQRIRKLGSR